MNRYIYLLVILIMSPLFCFATHERAGEITYSHVSGLTYEFTLVTYTYSLSPADRPSLTVSWGDGTSSDIYRTGNGTELGNYIKRNVYTTQHSFPAAGSYTISMEDQNRNQGIINIPNSVNIPFYIETTITINNFISPNNSPVLHNPPIDMGCVGVPFYHNPVAIDPDGDSLSYSLVNCRGLNGEVIPGYELPLTSSTISINPVTGEFCWDSPMIQGEYNVAILIEEFRMGAKISSIVRDMQITISSCNNNLPNINAITDTCVTAGDLLSFVVTATDDNSQIVSLSAMGDAMTVSNPAVFPSVSGTGSVSGNFSWQTDCLHARKRPYQVVFKATDNGSPVNLTKLHTTSITVVSPGPQNLSASASENDILLSWTHSPCSSYAAGYKIYRRINASGFIPDHCQTGVPTYTGYQLIATTDINTTTYIDNNAGNRLLQAIQYCYIAIAYFDDGSESYASNETCAMLKNIFPIITHVSVVTTDSNQGEIEIRWLKPKDIDSSQFQGPYEFELEVSANDTNHFGSVALISDTAPTAITDIALNTEDIRYFYRLKMFNLTTGNVLMGTSDPASSVFLSANGADRRIELRWKENTPWQNYQHTIYRHNNITNTYDSIATTLTNEYIDTGLQNGNMYCYYVQTWGNYSDSTIIKPLLNNSQIICASPLDKEAPCCPSAQGNTDCQDINLNWRIDSCNDTDIKQFYIYYKSTSDAPFGLFDSVPVTTLNYSLINPISVIGCFAVTAIDSNGNESNYCNQICFDTDVCNRYRVPNLFTPNGDGINDLFCPYPYEMVESAKIYIYNRWGYLMFKTNDPNINWNGTNQTTGQPCVDGVYYYTIDVNEYTLNGVQTRHLSGSITIIR